MRGLSWNFDMPFFAVPFDVLVLASLYVILRPLVSTGARKAGTWPGPNIWRLRAHNATERASWRSWLSNKSSASMCYRIHQTPWSLVAGTPETILQVGDGLDRNSNLVIYRCPPNQNRGG